MDEALLFSVHPPSMPQGVPMGPPPSPRETRRSGRRSAPSASASASKSPDSDQPPNRERANSSRTAVSSHNHRNKRLKQDELDEPADDRKQTLAPSASSASNGGNSKGKRKGKDKEKQSNGTAANGDADIVIEDQRQDPVEEEEEQGITRCVCGSSGALSKRTFLFASCSCRPCSVEDDPDAGEFMVQCETCKVWQHGLCMGYQSEEQVHDDDYYCEICRPELHVELLKQVFSIYLTRIWFDRAYIGNYHDDRDRHPQPQDKIPLPIHAFPDRIHPLNF